MKPSDPFVDARALLLRQCMKVKAFERLARSNLSPAFYHKNHPHYGELAPGFREEAGQIRVVGFPKSGNVWAASLVATCLGLHVEKSSRQCQVTHSHKLFESRDLFDKKLLRGAVLIRDLRDVIVSLFYFTKSEHFKSFHGPHHVYNDVAEMYTEYFLPFFVNRINYLEALPGDYVYHGWPVLKYEKLWQDPAKELVRLFECWQVDVAEEKIHAAIEQNSLAAMKKGAGRVSGEVTAKHFRKGGGGNYKDELPPHILKDIEKRFGDYLTRWGYALDTQ